MTGSSPRYPLQSNSLVCIKNNLFIVGIGKLSIMSFLGNFQSNLSSGKWKGGWLENLNEPQLGCVLWVSIGKFGMDPRLVMPEDIWWETVRVICSGHQMEDWLGGH